MNSLWHKAHVLSKKATLAQRIAWHREHQAACACRPIPASLRDHFEAAATPPRAPKARSGRAPSTSSGRAPSTTSGRAPSTSSGRAPSSTGGTAPALPSRFSKIVASFAGDPRVTFGNRSGGHRSSGAGSGGGGFGRAALKWDGKIFAMFSQGRFVTKLPRERVDELVEKGLGERFDPGRGRVMKDWLVASPSNTRWLALAREALDFAKRV